MKEVGIDILKFIVYSFRVVFISFVDKVGVFIEVILVFVGWFICEMFFKFYYKEN